MQFGAAPYRRRVQPYRHRLHDTTGDDLGLIEHPAPNVEPGDVLMLADGREVLVANLPCLSAGFDS